MVHTEASIHPRALVEEGASVGPRTRVWAFAHILSGAVVGADCNICDHTFIEGGVALGDRVTVKSGVYLWTGVTAEDDVFLGPAAAFTNDPRPRSRAPIEQYPATRIERGASVGANATILPGLTLGPWSMVGAGAVVTADVPAHTLVKGVPARPAGLVCRCGRDLDDRDAPACACGLAYARRAGELAMIEDHR